MACVCLRSCTLIIGTLARWDSVLSISLNLLKLKGVSVGTTLKIKAFLSNKAEPPSMVNLFDCSIFQSFKASIVCLSIGKVAQLFLVLGVEMISFPSSEALRFWLMVKRKRRRHLLSLC